MANNQSFVNGTRIDSINYLNYLKLIHDKLYIGFLNRSETAWGNAVLIGIDTSALSNELDTLKNIDLYGSHYYIKLFSETTDTAGVLDETCHLWKLLRINDKWALIENITEWIDYNDGTSDFDCIGDISYTDYVKNLSIGSYFVDIYELTLGGTPGSGTLADPYNATGSAKTNYAAGDLEIPIRFKNIDSDFYNANRNVYLASSGMTTAVSGFEDLIMIQNSRDNSSIKIVNVPNSLFTQIANKTINMDGRKFDVMDSLNNSIIIKGISFNSYVEFNDVKMLKFTCSTSKGDKIVLATNNIYDTVYEIYPDYTVDLLTEMINDNLPPGIDYSYVIDNYITESLFIPDTEETFDYTNFVHWDFIKNCTCTPYFASLANETNRLISGSNGFYLDNSVYVAKDYDNGNNWDVIKENNLNKLLLTFDLDIVSSAVAPIAPADFDRWYDTNPGQEVLKMYQIKEYTGITSISTPDTIVINGQDLTDYILVGDDITLDGFDGEVTNNGTFEVESITYADGNTTIVTIEETLLTEAVDGTETITSEGKWITMTNTDIRQLGVFYYDGSTTKELIYLTNINKINPIGTISFQLII